MSDPSTSTTPLPHPSILTDQHNLPLIHSITTAQPPPPQPQPPSSSSSSREYRKGNWTIQETLILITAKKLDDERRLRNTSTSTSTPSSSSQDPNRTPNTTHVTSIASPSTSTSRSSGELRWKWVENYCWSHGCLRSQNQCNDKWDNLLRDYKKVRDYESKSESSPPNNNSNKDHFPSYWILNKQQRKEQNLPSNMVFEVYQAISEVLQRKQSQRNNPTPLQQHQQQGLVTLASSPLPALPLQTQFLPPPPPPPLPPPLPLQQPPPPPHAPAVSERTESSDSEKSEDNDEDDGGSESKRRKVKNLGSSIMRSASVLARALRRCEEKKEKRHRELIELEQRRIQMEESRNEVHRQGIATLVAAVSNLSGAIHSFINSEHHGQR
ncbi:trihelix transcription factor ASR3 [Medicago truncatula]|uniref:Myb/SANT-like DNA-binding domain protein n=1 Tax=Medicago truncatula TaxID=3880 RepID=A0A072VPY8_MEDTR|nr:trihelix transcription factor ASR3 [Medicago truncatula]KEH43463.1 Myb/SANT-like DNA-binding domain protein [Medicago truncatula]